MTAHRIKTNLLQCILPNRVFNDLTDNLTITITCVTGKSLSSMGDCGVIFSSSVDKLQSPSFYLWLFRGKIASKSSKG